MDIIVDDPVRTGDNLGFADGPLIFLGSMGAKAPCARRCFVEIPVLLDSDSCGMAASLVCGFGCAFVLVGKLGTLGLAGKGGTVCRTGSGGNCWGGGGTGSVSASIFIWLSTSEKRELGESVVEGGVLWR